VFPHRPLAVNGWKLASGSTLAFAAAPALRFLLVNEGAGRLDGQELRRWSVARLQPGEAAELVAADGIELTELVVGLVNRPAASSPQTG
jgi:hypothetical protein